MSAIKKPLPLWPAVTALAVAATATATLVYTPKPQYSDGPTDPRMLTQGSVNGWSVVQEGTNLWIVYIQRLETPTNSPGSIWKMGLQ
jgi:hypothetical protein